MSLPDVLMGARLPGEATLGGDSTLVFRFLGNTGLRGDEGSSRSSFRSFCRGQLDPGFNQDL